MLKEKLRELRVSRGMTQEDAGYSTGVFVISVLIAELILILINIFVFPLVFDIAVKIFHG